MLDRLAVIETDLHIRRKRAEEERWLGEIEGIDLTLSASTANAKKHYDSAASRRSSSACR